MLIASRPEEHCWLIAMGGTSPLHLSPESKTHLVILSRKDHKLELVVIPAWLEAFSRPLFPGRLLLGFPGKHNSGIYRLLDARDSWNYHAVPIPPDSVY